MRNVLRMLLFIFILWFTLFLILNINAYEKTCLSIQLLCIYHDFAKL